MQKIHTGFSNNSFWICTCNIRLQIIAMDGDYETDCPNVCSSLKETNEKFLDNPNIVAG